MVENSFKPDVITCNILLRGLCKHGKSIDAVTYNTLISVLCKEGKLDEAFDLMTEMEKKNWGRTDILILPSLVHLLMLGELRKQRNSCQNS
ncbi:hypothetical protein Ahy_B01g056013 [Arachis hypogaea]|uniref:Pentatricopeptide repeat-containing protein n=1 Tax=Arachis hypogaea TaxID=3818 RepID=A0A445AXS7_ARAHY|nr:hypothetical protein Ahy_B01g056013 [Arachis hypogaea]